jgi:hypothetical protein
MSANEPSPKTEVIAAGSLGASFVRRFFLLVAVAIAGLVVYGFSQDIDERLFHPPIPRPLILHVHAVVFFGWIALFITQTTLIQKRNLTLHRRLGMAGVVHGCLIVLVGIATALTMARFNIQSGIKTREAAEAFLIIPFNDMVCFAACFLLAVRWRRRQEFHRRLMFMGTCCLTAAAFARFPLLLHMTAIRWYGGVDLLILIGIARDLFASRQAHPIYRVGFPLIVVAQIVTMAIFMTRAPIWMLLAHQLIG